eukprot:TRINITY_DN8634_c2_g1_i2.p1 TRINITY_DN8634_c2_g1~~TRINITY_DN8634_c2_g1_i2.p1  ORF type:complete len:2665 (+),score=482.28 TRINITY_DN8634_c2_g1_i2:59-8053(+)
METQLAALFEVLRGVNTNDSLKREDVDEISTITGMSVKASRKLLRKYRGNKDDALMAWFDKDVDSTALEAASDSENEEEAEVTERVKVTSDWPLFPDIVEWVTSTSGCTLDLEDVVKPKDFKALISPDLKPGDMVPPEVTTVRVPHHKKVLTPEEEEKEIFAGLSIGQAVRIRRYVKEMKQSRAGWKDDSEFDQKRLCGRIGAVRAVTRRDLTARVEFNGFGSGWWDIRWLEILPSPLHVDSACSCSGFVNLKGDTKQVKIAARCLSQITTCVRVGCLGVFLGPVRKAVEQVVPNSKGEVVWRSLSQPDGKVSGYQLCICDPRVVGPVSRCLEGDLTWNLDRRAAVSEEVVTRVAKLARTKTGCVVVSAPKGEAKMDAGALVIRNPRCWVGGNADGLEGNRVAPGVVLGCESGRAQVFWINSNAMATHRWGFDDTFDLVLMPCFAPVGRLLVVLVGIDKIPGLTWEMLIRVVREALTMEGADLVRQVLSNPDFKWNGDSFAGKINTGSLARAIINAVVAGWSSDGVLPPPLVTNELNDLLELFQNEEEPERGHLGIWREAKITVHQFYCSTPSRREGPICQHPGGAIQAPHWGCCGQQAKLGTCRQTERRATPLHPKHILKDRTMSIMSWACDRCKVRAEPQQGQRWRCDQCDFDLCDPCLHDSLREICKTKIVLENSKAESAVLTNVLDQETLCELENDQLMITPTGCKKRRVKDVDFTLGEDGAQPIVTFIDPLIDQPPPSNGSIHGFTSGQKVHAAKDIYVAVSVAVQQGGHGTVVGPSTSGDPRRVCVKFLGREAKINVMPVEVKQILETPRRAKVHQGGALVKLRAEEKLTGSVVGEVPCGSEVQVLEDGEDASQVEWSGTIGYVGNNILRELNTQSTVVMMNTRGMSGPLSALRGIASRASVSCNVPENFELTVGGKLAAIIVSNLVGDLAGMNGVYRRAPAEEDCRVIFRKGDSTLYFRGSWWKLNNNTRHDGWLQSSRALIGQWSPANTHDARTDTHYPIVEVAKTVPGAVVPTASPPASITLAPGKVLNMTGTVLTLNEKVITSVSYQTDTFTLNLPPGPPITLPNSELLNILGDVKSMATTCKLPCVIPREIELVESVEVRMSKPPPTHEELNTMTKNAVEAYGGDAVGTIAAKYGWDGSQFKKHLTRPEMGQLGKQLHELIGDKLTADISLEIVAPRSTTVAVVGPQPGRQKAKGFLSRLHDLQEVAIRVPSENHAVVERHRGDIQKHAHTHMNVGFGGAVVRLTGTASAIRHTRRAIATLLMKHWREQQRQRREVVLEQVVASAMEVRINVPLDPAMKELLNRKEVSEKEDQKRHDEAESERRQDEQRLVSMTQELSREYERLANSGRNQLAACGMSNVGLCNDDFTRGDRVIRGPTWQWGDQDGGAGSTGTVLGGHDEDGWVVVEWDKSGRLARHRTGPLFQDLQHLEPINLPTMLEENEYDLVTVLKARAATHMSRSLEVLRRCAVCKLSWAEEEHRQKGIVHEARIGVKEMEAAEKFQGWLRDLFGVKERAVQQVASIKAAVDRDAEELDVTRKLLNNWTEEHGEPPSVDASNGELCVCIVTEDQLYGPGNTPFDVCSRKSIPRHSRIRLSHDATVDSCHEAIEHQLGAPPEKQRLWYFALQPNGTFRPTINLKASNQPLLSACQPAPHTPGEVQLFVEILPDVPDAPSSQAPGTEALKWKVQQVDGFPGVPFRPSKDSQSTRDIPNATEVEVLEEDGEWVKVLWEGEEGFIRRRNVTKGAIRQGIVFLKKFDLKEGTVERCGFKVVDFSQTTTAELVEMMKEQFTEPPEADGYDVYVEEAPEHVRQLSDTSTSLESSGLKSGAILVFQHSPPPELGRSLKVGDVVNYIGPSNRSSILYSGEGRVTGVNHSQSQVKVVGQHGETEVFCERSLALDPTTEGLSYLHATVPAIYTHFICRKDLPPPQCKAGHLMSRIDNPRRYVCSYCQAPGVTEIAFWGCRSCDQNLCLLCTIETRLSTKVSPELSPRQQPGAGRFPPSKVQEMLSEHSERSERMQQSLNKHKSVLDGTVAEVLMHVRRMGAQRQHRRLFGWDLLLHLMDTTGCLLELQENNLVVVGRPMSVKKAVSAIQDMQREWPPSNFPTEAKIDIGEAGVDKLFSGAGIVARGLQFECGVQEIEPVDESMIWIRGRKEDIQETADRLEIILGREGLQLEWSETAPATREASIMECPVCLDVIVPKEDEAVVFGCGHSVHTDCGRDYLASNKSTKDSIPCLVDGCSYVLRVSEYSTLVKGTELQRPDVYYDNLLREALLKHDKVVACPFEKCTGWGVSGNVVGTVENLHCFECDRLFCPICRQLGHFFSQCEDVMEAAKIRAGTERRQKLEQEEQSRKAIAELCRPCPRCGAQVSRTEGCPHMTCKVCKFEFCYDCLRAIPHFGECDKAKLADRMRRVRAEHGGVIYHKYTKCDICGKHPIPDNEEAYTCLNCLHWSLCGSCEQLGKNCGYEGHILSALPRSDEPPAEAVVKGEKQKWRLKLSEVPHYEIDWDIVRNRQTPLTASSAAAGEGGSSFEKQVSNRFLKSGGSRIGLNLGTPLNGEWGAGMQRPGSMVTGKDLVATMSGTLGSKTDTILFEWEESEIDTESEASARRDPSDDEAPMHLAFSQPTDSGSDIDSTTDISDEGGGSTIPSPVS